MDFSKTVLKTCFLKNGFSKNGSLAKRFAPNKKATALGGF
jgi:hypothetical protein